MYLPESHYCYWVRPETVAPMRSGSKAERHICSEMKCQEPAAALLMQTPRRWNWQTPTSPLSGVCEARCAEHVKRIALEPLAEIAGRSAGSLALMRELVVGVTTEA